MANCGQKRTISSGWAGHRTLAGPDGVMHRLDGTAGDLFRYR